MLKDYQTIARLTSGCDQARGTALLPNFRSNLLYISLTSLLWREKVSISISRLRSTERRSCNLIGEMMIGARNPHMCCDPRSDVGRRNKKEFRESG